MEKEKWMQEFEKKQSRKRGYEEEDLAGEEDDSQFFRMADKTLMRMTSKDDTGANSPGVAESVAKLPVQEKVFKSLEASETTSTTGNSVSGSIPVPSNPEANHNR